MAAARGHASAIALARLTVLDDDDDDGIKPLFDYSDTVPPAPVCLSSDDSDNEDMVVVKSTLSKRKPDRTLPTEPFTPTPQRDQAQKAALDEDDDDDDSWLPSPSKLPKLPLSAYLDSTLRQLRSQRQELFLLQQETTPEAISRVEELARVRAQQRPEPAPPVVVVKTAPKSWSNPHQESSGGESAATGDKEKILLKVQNDTQSTQSIRIFTTDNFSKLFRIYADLTKLPLGNMVFRFDGDQISPLKTPKELEMDEGDIIEVYIRS